MPKDNPPNAVESPDLSVVIPCFNEADRFDRLEAAIDALRVAAPGLRIEFLLVDDGSADHTIDRMQACEARLDAGSGSATSIQVIRLAHNRGKGRALQAGVERSSGRWVLTADADMATPLVQVLDWVRGGALDLDAPGASVHIGSREHPQSVVEDSSSRRAMGRVFNLLVQVVAGLTVRDSQCGFKLYPGALARRLFGELRSWGWSHDIELLLLAREAGAAVVPMPVRWTAIAESKVNPLVDSVRMAASLLRIRASVFLRHRLGLGPDQPGRPHGFDRATVVVLAAAVLIVVGTFRDYGITWDEHLHRRYGAAVLDYYAGMIGGEPDRTAIGLGNLYLYGGLFDAAGQVVAAMLPLPEYESRHLLNALVGLLGVIGAARLARHLWGPRAGLLAALFLLLTPTYYGHIFANPKDVPFAAAFVWGLFYVVRALGEAPRISRGLAVKCAIAIGLTMAVRVGGLLLLCYLAVCVVGRLALGSWRARGRDREDWAAGLASLVAIALGAWVLMLAFWPFALERPIEGPFAALSAFASFGFRGEVLFAGEVYSLPGDSIPWSYVPRLLALQLPVPVLLLAGVSLAVLLAGLSRHRTRRSRLQTRRSRFQTRDQPDDLLSLGFVWFDLVFPIAHVIVTDAVLYDNLRHLTFLLPMIAVVSAHGADTLIAAATTTVARRAASAVVALVMLAMLYHEVRLHPYQYVSFNALAGGLSGAYGRYETDYWAASYREAVLELNARVGDDPAAGAPFAVFITGPEWVAAGYLGDRLRRVMELDDADFVITTTRTLVHLRVEGPALFEVERDGVPLAVVIDLRP